MQQIEHAWISRRAVRVPCIMETHLASHSPPMAVENGAPSIDLLSYVFENTVDDQDKPVCSILSTL